MTTLDKLEIGQSARIITVGGKGDRRQHFLDMGVISDAKGQTGFTSRRN